MADLAAREASGDGHDAAQGEVVITGSVDAGGPSVANVVEEDAEAGAVEARVVGTDEVPQPGRILNAAQTKRQVKVRRRAPNCRLRNARNITASPRGVGICRILPCELLSSLHRLAQRHLARALAPRNA